MIAQKDVLVYAPDFLLFMDIMPQIDVYLNVNLRLMEIMIQDFASLLAFSVALLAQITVLNIPGKIQLLIFLQEIAQEILGQIMLLILVQQTVRWVLLQIILHGDVLHYVQ
jgi:hypothetical protein